MTPEGLTDTLLNYWQSGGPLMYPLSLLVFGIFYLFLVLRHKLKNILSLEIQSFSHQDLLLFGKHQLSYFQAWFIILTAMVCAAPLMGLLGTVMGMIETFQALGDKSGETLKLVSGGIKEALVTTQIGLMAALPGSFAIAYLRSLCKQFNYRVEYLQCLSMIDDFSSGDEQK